MTMQASHFNTDVVNRAGFSKLFMGHSDKMWARGKVRIICILSFSLDPKNCCTVPQSLKIFKRSKVLTEFQDMMKYVLKRGGKMGTSFQVER